MAPKRPPPPPRRRKKKKANASLALDTIRDSTREARSRDPAARRVHHRMLKAFLPFYATEILQGPEEYGGKFLLGSHHLEWGEICNEHPRILALAARDHGKSHFWCFAYPLWMADRRAPGKKGYIFSATATQAEEHLAKIRDEIIGGGEHGGPNPKLAHLLPFKKDTARTLKFANNSEIRARGFGTRVRGGHPFWAVGDDVGNDDWIWSETTRTKAIDYFLSAIEPMIVPGGQLIVVGTPFHAQDLYNHLEESGAFHIVKHPAIDEVGAPLWPERYDEDRLAFKRKVLGSALRWSREYLCQPISDEASLFPSWLFDTPGIKQPYRMGMDGDYWVDTMGFDVAMGVDLAMSASAGADYFVIFVMAIDPKSKDRYVVDIIRRKGLGYQAQVDLIVATSKIYRAGMVFVEANQYQRVISDMVIRSSDAPIKAFYTSGTVRKQVTSQRRGMTQHYTANKNALDQGVPALRMLFENSKIRIPWHPDTRDRVKVWTSEMQAFGWAEGKLQGVGAHDDTVMSMWFCDKAIEVMGSAFMPSFGPDDVAPDFDAGDPYDTGDGPGSEDVDFFGSSSTDWRPQEGVAFHHF